MLIMVMMIVVMMMLIIDDADDNDGDDDDDENYDYDIDADKEEEDDDGDVTPPRCLLEDNILAPRRRGRERQSCLAAFNNDAAAIPIRRSDWLRPSPSLGLQSFL